jgi:site-specific DNA-cytosine methylase
MLDEIPAGICAAPGKSLADMDKSWPHQSSYRRPKASEPFPTIIKTDVSWIHPSDDRFMSIRELARCQSFPDSCRDCGNAKCGEGL